MSEIALSKKLSHHHKENDAGLQLHEHRISDFKGSRNHSFFSPESSVHKHGPLDTAERVSLEKSFDSLLKNRIDLTDFIANEINRIFHNHLPNIIPAPVIRNIVAHFRPEGVCLPLPLSRKEIAQLPSIPSQSLLNRHAENIATVHRIGGLDDQHQAQKHFQESLKKHPELVNFILDEIRQMHPLPSIISNATMKEILSHYHTANSHKSLNLSGKEASLLSDTSLSSLLKIRTQQRADAKLAHHSLKSPSSKPSFPDVEDVMDDLKKLSNNQDQLSINIGGSMTVCGEVVCGGVSGSGSLNIMKNGRHGYIVSIGAGAAAQGGVGICFGPTAIGGVSAAVSAGVSGGFQIDCASAEDVRKVLLSLSGHGKQPGGHCKLVDVNATLNTGATIGAVFGNFPILVGLVGSIGAKASLSMDIARGSNGEAILSASIAGTVGGELAIGSTSKITHTSSETFVLDVPSLTFRKGVKFQDAMEAVKTQNWTKLAQMLEYKDQPLQPTIITKNSRYHTLPGEVGVGHASVTTIICDPINASKLAQKLFITQGDIFSAVGTPTFQSITHTEVKMNGSPTNTKTDQETPVVSVTSEHMSIIQHIQSSVTRTPAEEALWDKQHPYRS